MKRLHAIVEGRVQGVYYRDFVCRQAERLQLTGWVRNLPDGTVEVLAEGEDITLDHLVLMLGKGSPRSRVDEVRTTFTATTGEFQDFQVRG